MNNKIIIADSLISNQSFSQKYFFKNKYFFSIILGAISATAFAPLYFASLAMVAFSALFLIAKSSNNKKQSFWLGWCFGFGQFTFGLYWICISLFVDIAKFFWLLPFALFLIPATLAIYTGLVLLLTNFIAFKFGIKSWRKILLLAFFWVLLEFARSFLFTGFPWNLLGYSLLFSSSLSQIASVFGVYGLSFIAIILYTTPALLFKIKDGKIKFDLKKKSQPFLAVASIFISLIWIWGFYRLNFSKDNLTTQNLLPKATFRLVQANIEQKNRWDSNYRYNSFEKNIKISHQEGFEKVNYVVWSESAVPYVIDPKTSQGLLFEISTASPKDGFVITGALRAKFNEYTQELNQVWNTVFAINSKGEISATYDKNHLVPFGEYIPFAKIFPFISKFTNGNIGFSEGSGLKTIKLNKETPSFSPLICYEAIFPNRIIDKKNPPHFLLNLTNDAWFGDSSGPYQHFDMVRMRSIEYGLPAIRVSNSGISGLIDPMGRVIKSLTLKQEGFIDVNLMQNLPATFYMKLGNKAVALISLLFLFIICIKKPKMMKK